MLRRDVVVSSLLLSVSPPFLSIQVGVLRTVLHKSLPLHHLSTPVPGTFWGFWGVVKHCLLPLSLADKQVWGGGWGVGG